VVRKEKKKLPTWTHGPLTAVVRVGCALPVVAGERAAGKTAELIGRTYAALPMNRKRLARASLHLAQAFPDLHDEQRHELALAGYGHLMRLGVELAGMPQRVTDDGWPRLIELGDLADSLMPLLRGRRVLYLTGHCGNWEVLGYTMAVLGFPMHAVYRPLDMKPLDKWLRETRSRRGLTLVDKFEAMDKLPALIERGVPVGFVADQNAGQRGMFVPYFGRLASTYKTIGLLAIKYNCVVVCAIARRRLGADGSTKFQIDMGDVITPEDWSDVPDPLFYLTARYRRAIERLICGSPEQYLWMHRIWKSRPRHERNNTPFPHGLREKLSALPWLDDGAVEAVVDRSDRDRAYLAQIGADRLP
jgi:KDO2-lipid IV(A) lauroyltransferase